MSDTTPISDHDATSEEEANELRKVNQDNRDDDTILGDVDDTVGPLTRPLQGDRQDDDRGNASFNDRGQRSGS